MKTGDIYLIQFNEKDEIVYVSVTTGKKFQYMNDNFQEIKDVGSTSKDGQSSDDDMR